MIIASAHGLTRRFGGHVAVDHLDLEVRRGEVLALLGHNGAGKTTTVRLFNGVLAPSEGEVRVFGLSPSEHGGAVRARVGVLTESPSLEERLTARQNLRYYAALYGYPADRVDGRIAELLDAFGLGEAADRRVGGFSKGMRQRLALARALQHEPELLFLDEPTSGLDPVVARQVTDMIVRESHEAGRTIVLCTHNLAEAQLVADRVAVLRGGRLVALGAPAELLRQLGERAQLRLELAADRLEAAERVLDGVAFTSEGAGSLLLSGVTREQVPHLVQALVAVDVPIYAVERRQPTLEDFYFALYGADGADGTGGAHRVARDGSAPAVERPEPRTATPDGGSKPAAEPAAPTPATPGASNEVDA